MSEAAATVLEEEVPAPSVPAPVVRRFRPAANVIQEPTTGYRLEAIFTAT